MSTRSYPESGPAMAVISGIAISWAEDYLFFLRHFFARRPAPRESDPDFSGRLADGIAACFSTPAGREAMAARLRVIDPLFRLPVTQTVYPKDRPTCWSRRCFPTQGQQSEYLRQPDLRRAHGYCVASWDI